MYLYSDKRFYSEFNYAFVSIMLAASHKSKKLMIIRKWHP